MQDSAQALDTLARVVADTAAAAADTVVSVRPSFVGDPVSLFTGLAVFALAFGFGIFAATWILVRSGSGGGGDQTTLTKLAAIAFGIGLSLLVWETFAISFLGVSAETFDVVNGWATSLILIGSGGALAPKVQATIVQREQVKRGQEPNGRGE